MKIFTQSHKGHKEDQEFSCLCDLCGFVWLKFCFDSAVVWDSSDILGVLGALAFRKYLFWTKVEKFAESVWQNAGTIAACAARTNKKNF